ncbi:acetyl-CoA carboxylase biotin carboxylase subunit [Alphaproteobacteria bacterium HT1-32]|nr:acetyl-CoA carboxylase biotin carboxylase subunit [Alphaproteobacteria bacterium HT1-32]
MFKKILIANRGEIACRVMRTAQRMGISTVAVHSEADALAPHVQMADEAVLIGPPPSSESYLLIDRIIDACKATGAEAVHPGYGFLSENPAFCQALAEAGIAFIGPDVPAIKAMGDKIESKKLAAEAGVSTVPGYIDVIKTAEEAVGIAEQIGFPVMIKASAGGGGKGMRVAWKADEVIDGFKSAASEAKSSFGDDRIFIEKYIVEPRHIEIQVLSDGQGTTLHLCERECSIQRRHQKVIEEAPSPFLDEATREKMGAEAIALADAVQYRSAGTVEFIVDKDRNFYFLEMNTRLQVEHPVTELITGVDLVEQMIRVAYGEKLSLTQKDIRINGWALESRVYAEDARRGFLPSIGRLSRYRPPVGMEHVRVDDGVAEGSEVSMFYDPMIAKLCSWGETRNEAIDRMRAALDGFVIRGVSHNMDFLAALVGHPRFVEGRLTTNFIAEEYPDGFQGRDLTAEESGVLFAVAGFIHKTRNDRNASISGQVPRHERGHRRDWVILMDGAPHAAHIAGSEAATLVTIGNDTWTVESDWKIGDLLFSGRINGKPVHVQIDIDGVGYKLTYAGAAFSALVLSPKAAELYELMPEKVVADMSKMVLSPMPGLLSSLAVEEGDSVESGQILCVIEAMKMENVIRSTVDGVVTKINAAAGDSLAVDQVIIEFE